ncbi:MAG TPA: shikimate dehydrogenase [Sphingorhabdus lacus]|nr:shikimate dehydrogenase [Sphingorhabdus lacus]
MTNYAEVIGHPISHSKSPLIHRFWLNQLGLVGEYQARDILPEHLDGYFRERAADQEWRGCNVTIPHKIAALDHVTDLGDVRSSIGAINTVFRGANGILVGTNTDAGGFYGPIADLPLAGETAVVIGAGGASRAVLFALGQADIGEVVLFARNGLKAAGLLSHFGLKGRVLPLTARLPDSALLVNASPLGMKGQELLEIDLTPLPEHAVVYDLVYAPIETALLKQARARELEVVDGLEMLVGQAAIAFELFFGVAPPDDEENALRELLLR